MGRDTWTLTHELRPLAGSARTIAVLFGIFLALYFVEFATLPLSVDDELSAFRNDPGVWVQQGRWATYLVELVILPQPILPFLPIAIFGVTLSAAFFVLLKSLGLANNSIEPYIAFPLFAGFPIWAFLVEFQSNTPAQGLGVLAACGSVAIMCRLVQQPGQLRSVRTLIVFAVAGLLSAFSIGAYQSNAMLIAVLGITAAVIATIRNEDATSAQLIGHMAAQLAMLVLGLALYFAILAGFRLALGVTESGYIDSYMQIGYLLANPYDVLSRSLQQLWRVYIGDASIYGTTAWAFGAIAVAAAAGLAVTPQLIGRPGVRILVLASLPVALLVPFLMNPLSNGIMPYRALVAVPAVMWFCAYLALSVPIRWLSWASLTIVAIATFQSLASTNLMQAGNLLMRQRDAAVATAIYQAIAGANPDFDRTKPYNVVFYGPWHFDSPYPQIITSTAGASFFDWGGNSYRIVSYMGLLGYRNLSAVPQTEALTAVAASMPTWPAEGSVRLEGDVTVVRTGAVQP